jgi:dihydropyrimidine dehydrogenase (NAD+) subunit PreA
MYPKPKVDISVSFCGVDFINPFILAAAPPSDDLDMVREAFRAGWAGAVLKTTSVEGTDVDIAYPMMSGLDYGSERLIGMGNIDLISEHHIDVIEKRVRLLKDEFPDRRVIVSISGQDEASWSSLATRATDAGADLIECSFSCPQGTMGLKPGAMLGQDQKASAKVAAWIKNAAGVPVIIKLTPQVADIAEIAQAVKSAGVDAVCVGNTVPALMGIDVNSAWSPIPNIGGYSTYSGLSGPAVKPISLRCIAEVSKATGLPIAGSGGATTWSDALEFMSVGAGVVEFCTAVMHYGFDIVEDLVEGVSFHLDHLGVKSIQDIIGRSLENIVSHDDLPRQNNWRAEIDEEKCVRCDTCMIACSDGGHGAITVDGERKPIVDDEKCVGCGLCSTACPAKCIKMKELKK